jgi:hypothetical protein
VPNNYDLNIIPLAVQEAEAIGIPQKDLIPVYVPPVPVTPEGRKTRTLTRRCPRARTLRRSIILGTPPGLRRTNEDGAR